MLWITAWRAGNSFNFSDVRNHLLLLDGKRHFWTILVEVKYYLVLPLLVFAVIWLAKRKWWLGLLGLAVFWFGMKRVLPSIDAAWTPHDQLWLHRYLQVFLLGSLAGIAHAIVISEKWTLERWAWLFELVAWACAIIAVFRIPAIRTLIFHGSEKAVRQDSNTFAILWAALIFCHLHGTGLLRRALENFALRYIGFFSFSVYLWHRQILNEVKHFEMAPVWLILIFFSALFILASVSYLLVERPLSRIRLFRSAGTTTNRAF